MSMSHINVKRHYYHNGNQPSNDRSKQTHSMNKSPSNNNGYYGQYHYDNINEKTDKYPNNGSPLNNHQQYAPFNSLINQPPSPSSPHSYHSHQSHQSQRSYSYNSHQSHHQQTYSTKHSK